MSVTRRNLRQMGAMGFLFFFVKGLAWLGVAAIGAAQAWI